MKNLFVLLVALLAISACTQKVDIAEQNKAIARRDLEEVWHNKNLSVVDEIYSSEYVRHDPADPQEIRGIEGYKQLVTMYLNALPDTRFTIEDQIAEGDKVVTRWTARGTHKGDLMGIAPTGKQITVTGMGIQRIVGGKVVEEWANWDTMGLMQQLGVIPPMEMTAK